MQCLEHFIHTPEDERVFVFGSNLQGIHGAGAARYAHEKLQAKWGLGEGPTGRCYALATCLAPGVPLQLRYVRDRVNRFIDHARSLPNTRFFVSEVGCGLAGFAPEEIAPLFANAPENCDLPPSFQTIIHGKEGSNDGFGG